MPSSNTRTRALLLLAIALASHLIACASPYPRRDPTGERFPDVQGQTLSGEAVALPGDLAGEPAVLLVGYVQDTQFDLDRWILGIVQAKLAVDVIEVPTIVGMVPGMIADTIDGGMRRGIPEEDWASVVTVYDDAPAIAAFTGNENPLPGRVLLLDATGTVVFFHDRGYSAGTLLELAKQLEALR